MANLQYGLKEVANVIFFNLQTGKPEIFFDTLKVSSIENESESAEARGGQGNGKLLSWDFSRTASLTMQDALLSDNSLAMLSGNALKTTGIKAVGRETLTVTTGEITLKETTGVTNLNVMKLENGFLTGEEATASAPVAGVVTLTGATDGDQVMAFYEYTVAGANATQVTFSADKFPASYRVVGDTFSRGRDGKDHKMQFIIPQAKLQSTFNLTMDVENVSVFDFNLDVLVESGTNRMYDIIRID